MENILCGKEHTINYGSKMMVANKLITSLLLAFRQNKTYQGILGTHEQTPKGLKTSLSPSIGCTAT